MTTRITNSRDPILAALKASFGQAVNAMCKTVYAGNAIQMGRAGIVYALEPEDIEILAEFAEELAHRVKLMRAGLSLTPPRMDDPAGPDGTTYPDQHKR